MNELEELKGRREAVRELLDKTIEHLKGERGPRFRDYQIFMEVYGDTPEMFEKRREFHKDIANCPEKVLCWCQEQINPKIKKEEGHPEEKETRHGTVYIIRNSRVQRVHIAHGRRYVSPPQKLGSTARSREIAIRPSSVSK